MSTGNCPSCGASIGVNVAECKYCGEALATPTVIAAAAPQQQYQPQQQFQAPQQAPIYYAPVQTQYVATKSKVAAGLLAIFLGGLGIHKFYLGRTFQGILYLIFCWTYIPSILGFIEGIIYLASNEENFQNKYGRRYIK